MMWDGMGGMNMTGWGLMIAILAIIFLALILVGVFLLVRATSTGDGSATRESGGQAPAGSRASEILDERFARGEIDEEEYRRRKEVLTNLGNS
jgi:putative membrane protein